MIENNCEGKQTKQGQGRDLQDTCSLEKRRDRQIIDNCFFEQTNRGLWLSEVT